jgi:hypothetical protein
MEPKTAFNITKSDLKRAIAWRTEHKNKSGFTEHCVVAQAGRRAGYTELVGSSDCGLCFNPGSSQAITKGGCTNFTPETKPTRIVHLFDSHNYSEVEKLLPHRVVIQTKEK